MEDDDGGGAVDAAIADVDADGRLDDAWDSCGCCCCCCRWLLWV